MVRRFPLCFSNSCSISNVGFGSLGCRLRFCLIPLESLWKELIRRKNKNMQTPKRETRPKVAWFVQYKWKRKIQGPCLLPVHFEGKPAARRYAPLPNTWYVAFDKETLLRSCELNLQAPTKQVKSTQKSLGWHMPNGNELKQGHDKGIYFVAISLWGEKPAEGSPQQVYTRAYIIWVLVQLLPPGRPTPPPPPPPPAQRKAQPVLG